MSLASFFGFGTEANNGKTNEELNAEAQALDEARRRRKEEQARQLEEAGFADEAELVRDQQEDWERQHAANFDSQERAINDYSVGDAFKDGLDEGAGNVRNTIGGTIKGVVGTVFKLLPWWLWLVIVLGAFLWFGGARFIPRRAAK
jgi:hypothetical protein